MRSSTSKHLKLTCTTARDTAETQDRHEVRTCSHIVHSRRDGGDVR